MTVEALWHQEADRTEVVLRSLLQNSVPFFAVYIAVQVGKSPTMGKEANGPGEG